MLVSVIMIAAVAGEMHCRSVSTGGIPCSQETSLFHTIFLVFWILSILHDVSNIIYRYEQWFLSDFVSCPLLETWLKTYFQYMSKGKIYYDFMQMSLFTNSWSLQ
jgi:hypothetical protein